MRMFNPTISVLVLSAVWDIFTVIGAIVAPKNVLLLSVDDLRPELACTAMPGADKPPGGMHTPNICSLAHDSLVLQRSQVAMTTCSPSRTAMLTGRRAGTTHVWDLYSYFRNTTGNFTTIPQFFKERGYISAGLGKIFHPGAASGDESRSRCEVCRGGDDSNYSWSEPYFHCDSVVESRAHSWMAVPHEVTDKTPLCDTQIMRQAKKTLAHVAQTEKPFFVAVGFHKPHLPFVFPEEFINFYEKVELPRNPYAPINMPRIAWQSYGETRSYGDIAALNATGGPNTTLPDHVVRDLRRAYYSSVSYTDFNIGEVLKALEATGKASQTIVVLWGDHGWQLGEHGEWDKHTNWDIATHAPVMFRVPGITDGGIHTFQATETIDIFPTLVELALGKEAVPHRCPADSSSVQTCVEGVSLVPLIDSPGIAVKEAAISVYQRGIPHEDSEGNLEDCSHDDAPHTKPSNCLSGGPRGAGCVMGYSMLSKHEGHWYRYIEWVHFPGPSAGFKPKWSTVYGIELYNHTSDPSENVNIMPYVKGGRIPHALSRRLHLLAVPSDESGQFVV